MIKDPYKAPLSVPWRLLLALPLLAFSIMGAGVAQPDAIEAVIDFGSIDMKLVEQPSSAVDVAQDTNFGHQLSGLGDFNEDGQLDVAVTSGDLLSISLGDGKGAFQFHAPSLQFFEETSNASEQGTTTIAPPQDKVVLPFSTLVADLNGDDHLDVMALVEVIETTRPERTDRRVYVFLGDGAGGLEKFPHALALETLPAYQDTVPQAIAGDFDEDGRAEVVLLQTPKEGSSDVLLLPPVALDTFFAAGIQPLSIARFTGGRVLKPFVGDLDSDGHLDLALQLADRLAVLGGDGRLHFTEGPSMSFAEGQKATNLLLIDLTHDGQSDGVALQEGQIAVYLRKPTGFSLLGTAPPGLAVTRMEAGDFNGDGSIDLILFSAQEVLWVVLGDGTGRFAFSHPLEYYFTLPSQVLVADLTGNGQDDLFLSTGFFAQVLLSQRVAQGYSRLFISGNGVIAVADLDGDGDQDLVTTAQRPTPSSQAILSGFDDLEALWNNGRGVFQRRPLVDFDRDRVRRAKAADLNGDGKEELILLGQEGLATVSLDETETPQVTYYSIRFFPPPFGPLQFDDMQNLGLGDLNGDGHLDAVATGEQAVLLWLGDGQGTLSQAPQSFSLEEDTSLLEVADLDGDGRAEVVAVVSEAASHVVAYRLAEGRLRRAETLASLQNLPLAFAIGDLNAAGRAELLVSAMELGAQVVDGRVEIFIAGASVTALSPDGQGVFKAVTAALPAWQEGATPWPFTGLALGDFNADGLQDVAVSVSQATPVSVYPGSNQAGAFAEPISFPCHGGSLFVEDLDANGQQDLIVSTLGGDAHACILWNGGQP